MSAPREVAISLVVAAPDARYSCLTNTTGMSEMAVTISPSPAARQVYNMMVARADDDMHLSLANSIHLSATLQRMGADSQASTAVAELRDADWITPVDDGGWQIT